MESLLILLAGSFVLLPLPLCIYLIVRANRLEQRVRDLEAERSPANESAARQPALVADRLRTRTHSATTTAPQPVEPVQRSVPSTATPHDPEPRPAPRPSPVSLLRAIGLWPPEELARRESGLIQWWFPRIGGLLAVLTLIFFAVYVSSGAAPWVKWVAMLTVDIAVIALGLRLHRRLNRRRFGSTLLSVGLAMLYVTVIAGYAAPPVRVFDNPLIGIAAQFLCVIAIFVTSLLLRDRNIGVLASLFGYASTVYSAYVGWNEGALLAAIVLQLASMFTGYRLNSASLITLASIGVYAPLAAFSALKAIDSDSYTLPATYSVLVFLCLAVSSLPAASLSLRLARQYTRRAWRLLQGANTTLCLATGYSYFRFFTNDLVLFYGALCLLFLGWSLLFLKQGPRSFLFQLFFIKAAGLAALWAANYFHGDLRWFALAIDAVIVAFVARFSASRWKEAASFSLWSIAIVMAATSAPSQELTVWSGQWILHILLPVLGIIAQAVLAKAMQERASPALEDPPSETYSPDRTESEMPIGNDRQLKPGALATLSKGRTALYTLAALVNGALIAAALFGTRLPQESDPAHLAVAAAVVAAIGFVPGFSLRVTTTSAAVPFVAAHFDYWSDPYGELPLAILLAVSLAAAYACARTLSRGLQRRQLMPEAIILGLAIVSLVAFVDNAFWDAAWLPFAFPTLALLVFALGSRPFKTLADTAPIPIAIHALSSQYEDYSLGTSLGILALYGLLLAWPRLFPRSASHPHLLRARNAWRILLHIFVAGLALSLASRFETWFPAALLLTLSGFGFFALWALHRHRSALGSSVALLAVSLVLTTYASLAAETFSAESAPWAKDVLSIGLLQSLGLLGCGIWLRKRVSRRISRRAKTALLYAFAAASFAALALSLAYPPLAVQDYYTPIVALYCLSLVVIGIALQTKPFRMIAIIGFLLPITRLFVYDVRETLYRIIAFAALATLLTLIGYLYNRFASRIE